MRLPYATTKEGIDTGKLRYYFKGRDILSIKEMSSEEINHILDRASEMKKIAKSGKKLNVLEGKQVAGLFFEPSTRTRVSFEIATRKLGADFYNLDINRSSVRKGETLIDTVKTLQSMHIDAIVCRHHNSGASHLIARYLDVPVINAGDGTNEHPTQALLDLFTMKEKKGRIQGLTVAIVGDILHSRVARSNIWGLLKLGANIKIATLPTLEPKGLKEFGVKVYYNVEDVIAEADIIMCLRIQMERQSKGLFPSRGEYTNLLGINADRIKKMKEDAIIMHPGPVNRGVEISPAIIYSERSVICEQVTNGIAVRMAILEAVMQN